MLASNRPYCTSGLRQVKVIPLFITGIFIPKSERSSALKPLSQYMSDLLAIQDNLFKALAEELLRTDLLHMTNKEQNIHKEYLPDSYVLIHYRTGLPPTRLHT